MFNKENLSHLSHSFNSMKKEVIRIDEKIDKLISSFAETNNQIGQINVKINYLYDSQNKIDREIENINKKSQNIYKNLFSTIMPILQVLVLIFSAGFLSAVYLHENSKSLGPLSEYSKQKIL